jgi:preprotein translocase subunit YajC
MMSAFARGLPAVVAQDAGGGAVANIVLIVLIFVVFYFLLIRPQQKQAKRQRALVASLASGDRVITVGGLYGLIRSVDDETLSLEIAPGTSVTVARQRIVSKVTEDDEDEEDEIGESG